ncbi:MAG: actin family protein [Candidatus Heimdallarchaeota archaeon]|nr:actin family protein [Candidatus Heimdallarchaeota archaeon]
MSEKLQKTRPKHCGKAMQRVYIRKGTEQRKWISIGYYCEHCSKFLKNIDLMKSQGVLKNQIEDVKLVERMKNPTTIVIDLGSNFTKVGFAGENQPRHIIESAIFYSSDGDTFIQCPDTIDKKKTIKKAPIYLETDNIEDKIDLKHLEIFFSHIFEKMKVDPSKIAILILERPQKDTYVDSLKGKKDAINNSTLPEKAKNILREEKSLDYIGVYDQTKIIRRKIARVLFDQFNISKIYFTIKELMSLYADGNITGLVVNIGASATRILPIYDGYLVTHSTSIRDSGANDVTKLMKDYTNKHLTQFKWTINQKNIIDRNIRYATEELCYVSENPKKEKQIWQKTDKHIRSANIINDDFVKYDEILYEAPEILFRNEPLSVTGELGDLTDAVIESAQKCDSDLLKAILSNIVLIGGGTLYRGFKERFYSDIRSKIPDHIEIKVEADSNRLTKSWIGGSILTSLNFFNEGNLWVSKAEYDEKGSSAVDRCI